MINASDTLRVPIGSKFTGTLTFTCQQSVNHHGEHCGDLVDAEFERADFDDVMEMIDEHLHRRCPSCRREHLAGLERDASIHHDIKNFRS